MNLHDKDICQSIDKNIIGTANVTKICSEFNIKLIYISTCYVYPGLKGNYSESSPLKPIIIMLGQNLEVSVQSRYIKTH